MISIDGSILIVKEHPNKGFGCNSQIASEPVADRIGIDSPLELVELTGLEPVTSWLQTRCSPN